MSNKLSQFAFFCVGFIFVFGVIFHDFNVAIINIAGYGLGLIEFPCFDAIRGIEKRRKFTSIFTSSSIYIVGYLISNAVVTAHLDELSRIVQYIAIGLMALTFAVMNDDEPPHDRSKNSVMSDALKKVIEKVASVYGTKAPIPVRW